MAAGQAAQRAMWSMGSPRATDTSQAASPSAATHHTLPTSAFNTMTHLSRLCAFLSAAFLLAVALSPALPSAQAQNVFTVDATGDAGDANAGDRTCDDGNGNCTLRAAIEEANATSNSGGPDEITFGIGSASPSSPHVIQPSSALPDIDDRVTIDGTTAQSYSGEPVVEIDGNGTGSSTDGFNVTGGGLTVEGLSIINFDGNGLQFLGGTNRVRGCHVGVQANGTTQGGNGGRGVFVNTTDTVIGGSASSDGNLISGNTFAGISLRTFGTADPTIVRGNRIGLDGAGNPMGNGGNGIFINGTGHTVGGIGAGEGNVIAHNGNAGIRVNGTNPDESPNTKNEIRGNRIFANSAIGIDLGSDGGGGITGPLEGPTENDSGDGDDGPNRLQNFPEILSADYNAQAGEVTVTYQVPSDPNGSGSGTSTYPLAIDFYRADADGEEGKAYLGTNTYTTSDYNTSTSGPDSKTITFTPSASVTRSDRVLATATDDNGNTSEFSAAPKQLPVELASFEAVATDTGARLTWQTASETNNAGFEVQRQKEEEWTQVGFVDSKAQGGTTTETTSYSFVAEDLPVGTHRFRLKQVDLDGSSTLTEPVTVDIQMQEAVKLNAPAPNPVSTSASLSFAVKEQAETTIRLYNTLGQQVATVYEGTPQAGDQQRARVDVSDLSSGTYFLRLQADGKTATRQVTVVR
jgi:hypothetical protein